MHISLGAKGTVTVVCCVAVKAALVGLSNVAKHRSFDRKLGIVLVTGRVSLRCTVLETYALVSSSRSGNIGIPASSLHLYVLLFFASIPMVPLSFDLNSNPYGHDSWSAWICQSGSGS